jgi:hypothetical protein
MIEPTDIQQMPGFNPVVTNGVDSVSRGLVTVKGGGQRSIAKEIRKVFPRYFILPWDGYVANPPSHPCCVNHGAMLRVSKDGIYRCGELGCDTGCYVPKWDGNLTFK